VEPRTRNILALGGLGIVLVLVAFWFLLLSPLLSELETARAEREAAEAQLQNLNQQVAELEAVRNNAPDIERRLLELSRRVPEQDEIPSLLVQIQEVADASGVVQLSVEPGVPQVFNADGVNYSRIPVEMSFEGTYEELQDFLFRVRNLSRLVTVNEVSYTPVDPTEEQYTAVPAAERLLQVEIQSEIYVEPAAQVGETTPAPQPPEQQEAAPEQDTTVEQQTTVEEDGTTVEEGTTVAP
jgi:type IV pilus assembly protein PilO